MRIFDRYIARQVLTATLAAVLVLSVVMVLGNIFRHLLSLPAEILRDMPPMLIARFIGYALVASLPFTVPWSLLTALLLVFGRLSADNELLAIRMGGNSFLRICLPVFAFALALSSLCFWINLHIAPLAQSEIVRLPTRMATANPQALLTADRIIDQIDDFVIYIGDKKDDGRLTEFQMIMLNEQRQSTGYINSRKVIVTENPEERGLDLQLNDSLVVLRDEFRSNDLESGPRNVLRIHPPIFVGQFEKTVTLRRLYEKLERMKPGMLPTRALSEKIEGKMAEARAAAAGSKSRRQSRARSTAGRSERTSDRVQQAVQFFARVPGVRRDRHSARSDRTAARNLGGICPQPGRRHDVSRHPAARRQCPEGQPARVPLAYRLGCLTLFS